MNATREGNKVMTSTRAIKINRYRTTYMWDDDADTPSETGTEHDVFTLDPTEFTSESLVDEITHMLGDCVMDSPSSYPDWHAGVWYSVEPYRDPYTGEIEEITWHLPFDLDEDISRAVFNRIVARH